VVEDLVIKEQLGLVAVAVAVEELVKLELMELLELAETEETPLFKALHREIH
jgi:hypothetical protein